MGSSKKLPGGRHAGFSPANLQQLTWEDKVAACYFGDAATTEGGKLARRLSECTGALIHYVGNRPLTELGGKALKARFDEARAPLIRAVVFGKSKLLREAADFFDARDLATQKGPAEPMHFYAAMFIEICVRFPRHLGAYIPDWFRDLISVSDALDRAAHSPSVREVHAFLCEVMPPDRAPDEKTAGRILKRLGSVLPRVKDPQIQAYRQFWG